MLYSLSLKTAGFIAGGILVFAGVLGLVQARHRKQLTRFPRSRLPGFVLLTIDLLWTLWLLATMDMGEFAPFRTPLLIALPIAYALTLRFVAEFLAVRALGILCLLAAEPLLDAAFFRYETSRLLVTVFAYILIVLGLIWVTMPYKLRDQLRWLTTTSQRWTVLHGLFVVYGAVVLGFALLRF